MQDCVVAFDQLLDIGLPSKDKDEAIHQPGVVLVWLAWRGREQPQHRDSRICIPWQEPLCILRAFQLKVDVLRAALNLPCLAGFIEGWRRHFGPVTGTFRSLLLACCKVEVACWERELVGVLHKVAALQELLQVVLTQALLRRPPLAVELLEEQVGDQLLRGEVLRQLLVQLLDVPQAELEVVRVERALLALEYERATLGVEQVESHLAGQQHPGVRRLSDRLQGPEHALVQLPRREAQHHHLRLVH
eukprot:1816067-Rhodomonas_salina.1